MPAISDEPATRIGFSGSAWVDTSYARTDSGRPEADPNIKRWERQARFVLRVTPTYSTKEGWFAQGQGEFVANGAAAAAATQLVDTDDLYVRAGKWNLFDVTAGRFQGWEVYHLGMALDLNTFERSGPYTNANPASPAQIYGVTHYWDRPNGPGNMAVHVYLPKPVDMLRFELMEQLGNTGGLQTLALRGVGIVDWGMNLPGTQGYRLSVKLKGGFETGKDAPREQGETYKEKVLRKGFGGSLQVVFDPYVDIGGGFAQGILDRFNSLTGDLEFPSSHTTTTFGGFLNVAPIKRLVVGFGYHNTEQQTLKCTEEIPPAMPGGTPTFADCSTDATPSGNFDSYKLVQYFAAIQGEILPNFFAKLVLAYGKADYNKWSDTGVPPYTNETGELMGMPLRASSRIRFMYLF
ncbi:MAG TPA: hypothetical protein VFZ53_09885, partial [Polyangiaceae bacterium]